MPQRPCSESLSWGAAIQAIHPSAKQFDVEDVSGVPPAIKNGHFFFNASSLSICFPLVGLFQHSHHGFCLL